MKLVTVTRLVVSLFCCSCTIGIFAETLKVGPSEQFAFPSVAAQFANDGDTIEIDANGMYLGDEAIWKANNLIIRGVNGTPELKGLGLLKNRKGLWVIQGNNTTIENISFSNAKVKDKNGAGIRLEGAGLIVRNCKFQNNQNGILSGANLNSDVIIEYSEFSKNGFGKGQTHNLYIGKIKSLTFRFNYSHHAIIGHNLKSRAQTNYILYNRIMDEKKGTSSYAVDLPNGGLSYLIGNIIQQGPHTDNSSIIAYGAEGLKNPRKEIYLVNNTIVNDRHTGIFIKLADEATAVTYNNIFAGVGELSNRKVSDNNNIRTEKFNLFRDAKKFNYELVPSVDAIDRGVKINPVNEVSLLAEYEYQHEMKKIPRKIQSNIDIGALEFKSK